MATRFIESELNSMLEKVQNVLKKPYHDYTSMKLESVTSLQDPHFKRYSVGFKFADGTVWISYSTIHPEDEPKMTKALQAYGIPLEI